MTSAEKRGDITTVVSAEVLSYLTNVPAADSKKPGVPFKWRRVTEKAIIITFGDTSYATDQTCYRVTIDEECVLMEKCVNKAGDSEVREEERVSLANPKVFDMVREFVRINGPKTS